MAVTPGGPSPDWERLLTDPQSPIHWVNVAGKKAKEREQEIERLGCDYNIKVWYSASSQMPDDTHPKPDAVVYEMRKAGSKKVLSRAALPPRTVYASREPERRQFVPYPIFADEIVKKLSK